MSAPGASLPGQAEDAADDHNLTAEKTVRSDLNKRDQLSSLLYLFLRTANSGATVLAGFLSTYLLVRRLGVDGYSSYVITTAVGIYLSATDAGISRTIYAKLREAFLGGEFAEERLRVSGAVLLYAVVTIVAMLIFCVVQLATSSSSNALCQILYFIFVALNLPWMLFRYIAWAVDEHLHFDSIDLSRRSAQIGVFLLVLTQMDLRLVFALLNLVWLLSFVVGAKAIAKQLGSLVPGKEWQRAVACFWSGYGSLLRSSAAFSLIEFVIYNFPFFFIPVVYGKGAPLVAFDLFYKLFRAGVTGNQIASTTVLPRQTRAFHGGDAAGVRRWTLTAVVLSITAVSPLLLILLFFGDNALKLLLSGASVIGATGLAAVVIAILSNSFQNAAGSLLVHVGLIRQGVHISYIILAIMVVLSAATALGSIGVEHFILAYAIAYALGAGAWAVLAARAISQHFANPLPAISGGPQ